MAYVVTSVEGNGWCHSTDRSATCEVSLFESVDAAHEAENMRLEVGGLHEDYYVSHSRVEIQLHARGRGITKVKLMQLVSATFFEIFWLYQVISTPSGRRMMSRISQIF